ncbi:MAG: TIGR03016 family PEP-CTERM system-associated outer membrane protein [Candidatus Thiodiazotropha sp. (ex Monitilora ramsayi)]|nr:TIGR03016 family PEP-CTERM system-associated outer membrane protein [Candidatus Thiodiazotropha sp. (ex Monitilora ramsayi)]
MKKLSVLVCGLGICAAPVGGYAADWIITPAITVEQVYTDNALLSNDSEESESISRITPSVSVYREGARASVDINYAPEYRHYWEGTEDNELVNFLRAEGNTEVVEDHVFLDGWATADLTSITSTGRTGIDGLTGRSDSTEVYTAGLSPYFRTRLGTISVFEARYTADTVRYSEDGIDDSVGQQADLVLGSGTAFSNQLWELAARQSQVDYETLEQDNEVKQVRGEFVQQLTRQWALAFAAGYEEFKLALNPDIDDSLWSVGVIYTPSPRTRIAIGGGERAFGDDYYLDFTHRSRLTIWTATYDRDFSSARQELLRPNLFQRLDAFGNLVRDPVLESPPVVERGGSATLTADFFEVERVATNFTLDTGRTRISLGASRTDRTYDDSTLDTQDLRFDAGFSRDISRLITGFLNLAWLDHEEEALAYDQVLVSLGGEYLLGASSYLGMTLAHLERDAETETESYEENRFSIFLTHTF